ncbi:TetR/AcrR family transcriptional regulator [Acidocella sp.]|uniref:TetR/AcrR family transcriptional regulator n=1 Tax=Acidocella sp. TaxID=50710 RepID=UPI003CFCFC44
MPQALSDERIAETRERIVRVAERQAVARGFGNVSMHSIARELGWSATALYRYFANKEAILAAARTVALDKLSATLEAAIAGPGDGWEISRNVGDAYVAFAFENPDAYRLIFSLNQPDPADYPEFAGALARAQGNMTRYVARMIAEGGLDTDPNILGHLFWAGLHGLITLQMTGKIGEGTPDFDTLRREMMRGLERGFRRT